MCLHSLLIAPSSDVGGFHFVSIRAVSGVGGFHNVHIVSIFPQSLRYIDSTYICTDKSLALSLGCTFYMKILFPIRTDSHAMLSESKYIIFCQLFAKLIAACLSMGSLSFAMQRQDHCAQDREDFTNA